MNKSFRQNRLRWVFITAALIGLLASLLPENIVWAGLPPQTVPTAGPSPTITSIPPAASPVVKTLPATAKPVSPTTTEINPAQIKTLAPTQIQLKTPTAFPTAIPSGANPGEITATQPIVPVKLTPSLTEPPGFVPTESTSHKADPTIGVLITRSQDLDRQDSNTSSWTGAFILILLVVSVPIGLVFLNASRKRKP